MRVTASVGNHPFGQGTDSPVCDLKKFVKLHLKQQFDKLLKRDQVLVSVRAYVRLRGQAPMYLARQSLKVLIGPCSVKYIDCHYVKVCGQQL